MIFFPWSCQDLKYRFIWYNQDMYIQISFQDLDKILLTDPKIWRSCLQDVRLGRGLIFYDYNVRHRRARITNVFFLKNHVEEYPNPLYSSRFKPLRLLLILQTQELTTWNSVYRRQRNINCFRTIHWQSHKRRL